LRIGVTTRLIEIRSCLSAKMRCRLWLRPLGDNPTLDLLDVIIDSAEDWKEGRGDGVEDLVDQELLAADRLLAVASAELLQRIEWAAMDRDDVAARDDHVHFPR
jgi:hypothetical protein